MNDPGGSKRGLNQYKEPRTQAHSIRKKNNILEFPKNHFKNTICIHIKNKEKFINRKEIYDALFKVISKSVDQINYISQFNNNSTWYISFNDNYSINELFGTQLAIADEETMIEDPQNGFDPVISLSFRVSWLPHNFSMEKVKKNSFIDHHISSIIRLKTQTKN